MTSTYPTVISRVFEETEFFFQHKNKTKFPTMKVNSALFNVNSPAKLVRPTPYNKNKIIPHDPLSTVGAPVRCKGMSLIMLPPNNCSWSRSEWLKTNFQLSLPKKKETRSNLARRLIKQNAFGTHSLYANCHATSHVYVMATRTTTTQQILQLRYRCTLIIVPARHQFEPQAGFNHLSIFRLDVW